MNPRSFKSQSSGSAQVIIPPEIYLNCAIILCLIHSFLQKGTINLRVNLRFNILLFVDHIEIFVKKKYIDLSRHLNFFETNMFFMTWHSYSHFLQWKSKFISSRSTVLFKQLCTPLTTFVNKKIQEGAFLQAGQSSDTSNFNKCTF